jgi:phospholipid-binding lipoprotein MlaA
MEPPVRPHAFAAILMLTVGAAPRLALAAEPHPAPRAPPFKGDPWESFNRKGYAINMALDKAIIRPLALLSGQLTPGPIGKGLHNALTNLTEPVVAFNDLAQAKVGRAAEALGRLAINTTFGLLGVVDVAAHDGVKHHDNTFGDTLGRYGVEPGPYLFIPLIGPSDVRDLFGAGVDGAVDPINWARYDYRTEVAVVRGVLGGLEMRASADSDLRTLLQDAADPYATLRSTYLQSRQGEVDEGRGLPALPDIDSPAAPGETSPPPPETPSAPDGSPTAQPPPKVSLLDVGGQGFASVTPAQETMALEALPDEQHR